MSTDHIAAAAKILAANIVNDADVRRASALAALGAATELRLLRQQSACRAVPMGAPDGAQTALAAELSRHRQALLRIEGVLDGETVGDDIDETADMQAAVLDAARRLVKDALGHPNGPPEAAHAAADVDGLEREAD